jgi:hypothetical protein
MSERLNIGQRVQDRNFPFAWGMITGQSIFGYDVLWDDGSLSNAVPHKELAPETFLQFITRRTGFGKTSWWSFTIIQAFVILGFYLSIETCPEPGWWITLVTSTCIEAILWIGTYRNWKGKQM